MTRCDTRAFFDDDIALAVLNLELSRFATQPARDELKTEAVFIDVESIVVEEQLKNLLRAVAKGAQQYGCRQLAAAVNPHKHTVFRDRIRSPAMSHALGSHARNTATCLKSEFYPCRDQRTRREICAAEKQRPARFR